MAEYKLTYYNFRSQQAEPIRYIFAYAGVPYQDIRIPAAETFPLLPPEIKEKLPYGQVPILEHKGHTISQSAAIGRFLAKTFGLAGANDIEAAKCDEIVDALFDFQYVRWLAKVEKNPEERAQLQKDLEERTFPKNMGTFTEVLKKNGGTFLVGKNLTWADFHMAYFIKVMEEKFPEKLKPYPELHKAARSIWDLPQIQEWNKNRPQDDIPDLHVGVAL